MFVSSVVVYVCNLCMYFSELCMFGDHQYWSVNGCIMFPKQPTCSNLLQLLGGSKGEGGCPSDLSEVVCFM